MRTPRLARSIAMMLIVAISPACRDPAPPSDAGRSDPRAGSSISDAADPASPDAWRVTARGAGRVVAGTTVAEAESAFDGRLIAITVSDSGSGTRDSGSEVRAPGLAPGDEDGCTYLRPSPGPSGLMFMIIAGRIGRVDVTGAEIATDAGVRVGDTETRVRELHTGVVESPHKYTDGHYLTLAPDGAHRLVFETDGRRVTRYRGGRMPEVEWVEGCG